MEEKWTVFSLNLGVLPQKPETMSFPSREAALKHACSLPPRVKILYIENTEGQRIQAEEVEKLCRIHSLLREYRTQQQFSRFEWDEIEKLLPNWKEPNTPMRNWWAESIITWQTLSDAATANEAETPHRPTDDARQQFKTYKRIAPRSS